MKNSLKALKNSENGSVTIIVVAALTMLIALLAVTVDMSRTQNARAKNQGSTDTAALSAADFMNRTAARTGRFELNDTIKGYAKTAFKQHLEKDQKDAQLDDSTFNVTYDTTSKILTVSACVKTKNNFKATPKESSACTTSSAQIASIQNIEVAIAADNGAAMSNVISGTATTRQTAQRTVLRAFSDKFKVTSTATTYKPGVIMSLIPYSDTVKLIDTGTNPGLLGVANSWLKTPVVSPSVFNGCMGMRGNASDYDTTVDDPATTASTKYYAYMGSSSIAFTAYSTYGKVIPGFGPANTIYGSNYVQYTFGGHASLPYTTPVNSSVVGDYESWGDQIEFNSATGTSERLLMDLGGPYGSAVSSIYVTGFAKYDQINCGSNKKGKTESGIVYYLDESGTYITHQVFSGSECTDQLSVNISGVSPRPFRYLDFRAVNNGGGYSLGGKPDNSDYLLSSITLPWNCNVQYSTIMTNNTLPIDTNISGQGADGPTRTNIGMAWAWRALSPKMQGKWPSNSTAVLPSNDAKKYMVVLTQGRNAKGATDDTAQLEICKNVKAAGIQIYYITFDADADSKTIGKQCASDGKYYDAPTQATLNTVMEEIGGMISNNMETVKLVH